MVEQIFVQDEELERKIFGPRRESQLMLDKERILERALTKKNKEMRH